MLLLLLAAMGGVQGAPLEYAAITARHTTAPRLAGQHTTAPRLTAAHTTAPMLSATHAIRPASDA